MARYVNIYRVVGRDGMGRIAVRVRVAAGTGAEALGVTRSWQEQVGNGSVTFSMTDVHKSADESVLVGHHV